MNARRLVPVVLVVVGLLLVAGGTAAHLQARLSADAAFVVAEPAPNATDPTAFEALSESERAVVRAAAEQPGSQVMVRRPVPDVGTVTYGDRNFTVTTHHSDGATPYHPLFVQAPWAGGGALVVAGFGAAALIRHRDNGDP